MGRDETARKTITVIGGGPAGMTAAICAARQGSVKVRLMEKNSILGRKLLATGNGRCNLTNAHCGEAAETLRFFGELGLLTREEAEGRIYPYSEQAASVQEILVSELAGLGVELLCGQTVQAVEPAGEAGAGFVIVTDQGRWSADSVILATGGKAGPQYGSTGDGYRFAKAFGHTVVRLMPSLVQLTSDQPFLKALKGVRAKGEVELLRDGQTVDREAGEIQFTEDGLSGICIFNLSREYVPGDVIKIDLFPEYGKEALETLLAGRVKALGERRLSQFLGGMLHKKLIPVVLDLLFLDDGRKAESLNREELGEMVRFLKGWRIPVTGTKGWKEAQVTAGGISLAEVDLSTMESRLAPGLFFAGELLNADGKCGGYNLQWAWSSAMTAGRAAAGGSTGK